MKLIKLIIFILVLSESECRFRIIEEKSDDEKSVKLAEAAMTMLSCYEKEVNTVGAVGISNRIFQKILSEQSIPVSSIDADTERAAVNNGAVDKISRHKLQLFVVEASSSQQLVRHLRRVKSSLWWNHMATYLIIDWPSQESQQGCSNAYQYLLKAWKRNLLNALYVCLDKPNEKVFVYSYNPYTSRAPVPWRLKKTSKGEKAHPWTMFIREYRSDNLQICINLKFAMTHDLGGYEIVAYIQTSLPIGNWTEHYVQTFFHQHHLYSAHIFKALKATPDLVLFPEGRAETLKWLKIGKKGYGNNKTAYPFDIMLNTVSNLEQANRSCSSGISIGGLAVLTQYRGEMSILDKLVGVLDRSTRLGLGLVAIITVLFFKFLMRQPIGSAFLNVARIVGNTSIENEPKEVAPRLYLAGVFILVVTIWGIYQGVIASLLTKPTPLPDVNTMQDLIDSPHKIHVHHTNVEYFANPKFNGRLVVHRLGKDCLNYVVRDPLVACVQVELNAEMYAINMKLHLSSDTIVPMDFVYPIRDDWPLEDRFNEIIAAFTESHIHWYVFKRNNEWKLEAAEYMEILEGERPIEIKLSDLGFAFAILGIGLGFATVAFIVEVAIKRT